MARAAVILVQDARVVLIQRVRDGRRYFVFPGGGVEDGESPEAAAAREAFEELGLTVRVGQLAATVELVGFAEDRRLQHYFWAEIVDGEFGTGTGEELSSDDRSTRGSYEPTWLPLEKLAAYDVRPQALADALWAGKLAPHSQAVEIVEIFGG